MKKHILILFTINLFFIIACENLKITNPDEPIEVSAGQEFSLVLGSNPSTGYHWEIIEPLDQNIINFLEKEYYPDAFSQYAAGAGGKDIWKFLAISPGETDICMGYFHPYDEELSNPSPAITFHVFVR